MAINRFLQPKIVSALSDTPVVLINGARQVGKTTLVRHLADAGWDERKPFYTTLDDPLSRSLAEKDPDGFIRREEPMIIDEIQTVSDLLRAIKLSVDSDRRPGRFLLTGSADVFTLPTAGESLAGRMEIRTLWPFAQAEIRGEKRSLIDELFSDDPIELRQPSSVGLIERVVRGGYPEALVREDPERRDEWFESYVMTILQRDVRELASIERLSDMPRLLQLIAARTATLANYSELSRALGIPNSSLKRYLVLLEATFLVRQLPAWSANLSKRLVRSPKIYLTDTGLASSLLNFTADDTTGLVRGQLLETFVMNEIEKHRSWASIRTSLYHYRTHTGQEVDLVLEDRKGRIVGIEVKGKSTLKAADFRGLESLREAVGERFHRGVVLYEGDEMREGAGGSVGVPVRWV